MDAPGLLAAQPRSTRHPIKNFNSTSAEGHEWPLQSRDGLPPPVVKQAPSCDLRGTRLSAHSRRGSSQCVDTVSSVWPLMERLGKVLYGNQDLLRGVGILSWRGAQSVLEQPAMLRRRHLPSSLAVCQIQKVRQLADDWIMSLKKKNRMQEKGWRQYDVATLA